MESEGLIDYSTMVQIEFVLVFGAIIAFLVREYIVTAREQKRRRAARDAVPPP